MEEVKCAVCGADTGLIELDLDIYDPVCSEACADLYNHKII